MQRITKIIGGAIAAGAILLGVGACTLAMADDKPGASTKSTTQTAAPEAPTPTTSEPSEIEVPDPEVTEDPAPEPEVTYTPTKSDVELTLKQTSKKCYGSAGCNVGYKVKAAIDAATLPSEGTLTVYYTIKGSDDGAVEDSIDLDLSEGTYDSDEDMVSTSSKSKKLTIKVTDIEYSEY